MYIFRFLALAFAMLHYVSRSEPKILVLLFVLGTLCHMRARCLIRIAQGCSVRLLVSKEVFAIIRLQHEIVRYRLL